LSQPYVGQIIACGFNFAPAGWAICDGSLLPISEYETLFNLIGTTYGGDGQSTFAVPDLRGRVPIHNGQSPNGGSYIIGQSGGVETVTLNTNQMPRHSHPVRCSANPQNSADAGGSVLASTAGNQYSSNAPAVAMGPMVGSGGGSQPHDNMQPYLVVNWVISLFGIFPSQT
jgi:microcystin-dependent protein